MPDSRSLLLMVALFVLGQATPEAHRAPTMHPGTGTVMQDEEQGYNFAVGPGGLSMGTFIDLASRLQGCVILHDGVSLGRRAITMCGVASIETAHVSCFVEELALAHGIVSLQRGEGDPRIVNFRPIEAGERLREFARYVAAKDLESCGFRPGQIFISLIPLEYADAEEVFRLLMNFVQENRLGSASVVESQNAVLVTGLGGFMAVAGRLIDSVEKEAREQMARSADEDGR